MKIPPSITIPLGEADALDRATLLPKGPGVYAFRAETEIVHLGWSPRLSGRIVRLLSRRSTGSTSLGDRMGDAGLFLNCWPTGSKLESSLLMYQLLRSKSPADYRKRLRLNLPWFLALTAGDPFPRLVLMNRIPTPEHPIFGPFQSRDRAQRYADEVLGCFALRRCTDPLVPDPDHPGCIYGEIKQCLRPCQRAVTEQEYGTEVERVYGFLLTNGKSNLRTLTKARDEAAVALQFEEAADLHKTIVRVKEIAKERDDLVCDARGLTGIALTRGIGERVLRFWPMVNGLWQEPWEITADENATPESVATRLKESSPSMNTGRPEIEGDAADHLALLLRWYHSSWRDGEWLGLRPDRELNHRRLVKAMAKVLSDE
ncbi:MAG: hypothetical protein ACJ746_12945 [Bryobacteraceae bacterium]